MIEIRCPKCDARFEVEENVRGAVAECGVCSAAFKIPDTGTMGIPFEEVKNIEVICPECKTSHQVPESARGVEAECGVCNINFRIPSIGIFGESVNKQPAASAQPRPGQPSELETIQQSKKDTSFSLPNRSQTLRMSRSSIVTNTMIPQLSAEDAHVGTPKSATPPPRGVPGSISKPPSVDAETAQTAAAPQAAPAAPAPRVPPRAAKAPTAPIAPAEAAATAADPVKQEPSKKRMPEWVKTVPIADDEQVLDWRESSEPGNWWIPFVAGLVPVGIIPLATLLGQAMGPMLSAVIFTVIGLLGWALSIVLVVQQSTVCNGLIVTNKRAIMVSDKETLTLEK